MLTDTNPVIANLQIDLIRAAGIEKRFELTRSMTMAMGRLSRLAIERANPSLSERAIDLLFVEYHYGKELADRLRQFLRDRSE